VAPDCLFPPKNREPSSCDIGIRECAAALPKAEDENCAIEGLKATFGEYVTLPVYPAATAEGGPAR